MPDYEFGKKPKRKNLKVIKILLTLAVVALLIAVSIVRNIYNQNLQPVSSSQRPVLITVEQGSSVKEIAISLEEQGLIKSAWAFEWYVRNSNSRSSLQAGTYSIRPSQNIPEIVSTLTQGDIASNQITIIPGQRIDQIRSALINNAGFSEQEVDRALQSDSYSDEPALVDKPIAASLEGYIYPDTYQFTAESRPEEVIEAALSEMHGYLTPELRTAIIKQGLTTHEGVILASIILNEVSDPKDMKVVAQVFHTRLRNGMRLESDPTIIYGAIRDNQKPSLNYDSSYNTYTRDGLPPGPISNVTKESLEAVANPANTDYLYFVAGDDGKTHFSRTLQEHEENTHKYCTQLCQ